MIESWEEVKVWHKPYHDYIAHRQSHSRGKVTSLAQSFPPQPRLFSACKASFISVKVDFPLVEVLASQFDTILIQDQETFGLTQFNL